MDDSGEITNLSVYLPCRFVMSFKSSSGFHRFASAHDFDGQPRPRVCPKSSEELANWDYRYTWLRDAAFTVYAFLRIGFRDEADAFMSWIEDYASKYARSNDRAQSSSRSMAKRSCPSTRWITGKAIEGPVRCPSATQPFRSSRETSIANSSQAWKQMRKWR